MRARTSTLLLAAALALPIAPPPAAAQVPAIDLQLVPKIGAYVPVSDLGELTAGAQEIVAEMEASLAIGLALELDLPFSPLNVRGNFDYATGSEVSGDGIEDGDIVESTVLALTGDLVFRPLPRIAVVQPYLLAGAGIKRYDFELEDAQNGLADFFEDSENDFTLHAGAGLDLGLGPLALLLELNDYISWFDFDAGPGSEDDSEIQNDVFGMVGVRVGLF